MARSVPEAAAELMSADDVHRDVLSLTAAIQRRQAERRAYALLSRPAVRTMLDRLVSGGVCKSEEDAIEAGLRALVASAGRRDE